MEQQQQVNIKLEQTKAVKCKCGNDRFQQVLLVREVSGILVGTKDAQRIHIPVLECSQCGEVLQDSIPPDIADD